VARASDRLDEATAGAIAQESPAFSGTEAKGRHFLGLHRLHHFVEQGQEGWLAEFEWREAGRTRTGVSPFVRLKGRSNMPFFFQTGGWAMVAFLPDQTIEEVLVKFEEGRRETNEFTALADIRTMISAQASYSSVNGGFYDEPRCLMAPSTCLPGYGKDQPRFLLSDWGSLSERRGYHVTFHSGYLAALKERQNSASSIVSYAVTAVPVKPGLTGRRAFCGDDRARVCFTADGTDPKVVEGRCVNPCREVK
jgi:hypothetical protein